VFTSYHYKSSALNSKSALTKSCIRRLATEYSDLSRSLPVNMSSSIFMRVSQLDLTQAQILIIPPDNTPYAYGCFIFDIHFPSTYPSIAPHVNLQTTGGGSVRFNPNLYNCGKVCLSLLGTWTGDNKWNPTTSTFLQVCISLQSLVFVPDPFFNEPGYENNPSQKSASDVYNRNIRIQNVRHAMIGQLRSVPAGWKDVIQRHFRLSQKRIELQVDQWAKLDSTGASTWTQLKKDLTDEFSKLK